MNRTLNTIATKDDLAKAGRHIKIAIVCAMLGQVAFISFFVWLLV